MNRALFITIGVVIILITIAVWIFLLLRGDASDSQDVFSNLGITPEVERPLDNLQGGDENTDRIVLSLNDNQLQQLTTNPVAGFSVATSSQSVVVRYVELGTGHIFDINLNSGLQTAVTPNTTANTIDAIVSPDLHHIVITAESESRIVDLLNIPRIEEEEVSKISLPGDAENIAFINDSTVRFTRNTSHNTTAYTYNIDANEITSQTNLIIPDATVVYDGEEDIFAYPKPTTAFLGALYHINNRNIEPLSTTAQGFVPLVVDSEVIAFNYIEDDEFITKLQPDNQPQNIVLLPEKCVGNNDQYVWCGAPNSLPEADYLEDWYKGKINSDDTIWTIDTYTSSTTELVVPKQLTGRQIDLINPQIDPTQTYLLFNNKIDQTLWLLRL